MKKLNLSKIFSLCNKIPPGRISTYKELAKAAGYSNAVRAVANALKKSPAFEIVACHRIIRSNGFVGGYNRGIAKKVQLLKKEGLKIKNNKVLNYKNFLYFF